MPNPLFAKSLMLNGANNNTFTNSTFTVKSDGLAAFDKLEKAASPSAFHSFVGRPQPGKCYPNTRVSLLKELSRWTQGISMEPPETTNTDLNIYWRDEASLFSGTDWEVKTPPLLHNLPIIWLKGGAGAGKSAVAQTFAERCEDLGHIVASFFFFSTDPTRNDANRLVATLAYQIACADANARAHIEAVVHQNPRIFDQDFTKQLTSLIVDPIQKSMHSCAEESRRSCTVIIDGLDECTGGEVQVGIVRAIADSLRTEAPTAPSRFPRFLICSRPEEPIMRVFRSASLAGIHTSIDLSQDHHANDDIKTFLEGKFAEIKQTHRHADRIPEDWPSWDYLRTLEWNSSGHFVYADTVVKFVSADARPVIALESILGLRASPQRVREPFAELDVLYHHILSQALEEIDIDTIQIAFGLLGMKDSPATDYHSCVLERFLDLPDGNLDILFNIASSLVSVQWSQRWEKIKFCHKSLNDFLHDQRRAGQFYIDDDAIRIYVAARCHAMTADIATLDSEMCALMAKCEIRCSRGYDYLDGKQCHSFEGMTRRRQISDLVRQFTAIYTEHHQGIWVVWCLEYYCSLIFRNGQENSNLLKQATRDIAVIMRDLFHNLDRIRNSKEQNRDTHRLALVLCQPVKFIKDVFQWSLSIRQFAIGPFASSVFDNFVANGGRMPSQEDLYLVKELLEALIMGGRTLRAEKYTEACLYWATKLTKHAHYFPCQRRPILENQRCIIMREPARRLRAPFQWRKTRHIIRPYSSKNRFGFLHSYQWFHLNMPRGAGLVPALTNRQLLFGSRPNLVGQIRQHCGSTADKHVMHVLRGCRKVNWSRRSKASTRYDKWTTIREYSQLDHRAIRCRSSTLFDFDGFYPLEDDQKLSHDFYLLPSRRRLFRNSLNGSAGRNEQTRREQFSLLLSRIPAMLANASKSDDLAALRFKAFPPFATRFPKLMRRARQAMEDYAVRHGYPAIEGTFGSPMQHAVNHAQDAVHVTNTDVASTTFLFVVKIWLECLCLRLVALLGGLDAIYTLR